MFGNLRDSQSSLIAKKKKKSEVIQIQSEQEKPFSDLLVLIVRQFPTVIWILLYLPIGRAIAAVVQVAVANKILCHPSRINFILSF